MELTSNFVQVVENVVLHPSFTSAPTFFFSSFVNELFAILPYNIILSGQLLFHQDPISIAVLTRLFLFIAVPVGVGTTLGSLLIYSLAYFGGKPAINKFGRYFRFSWESVEKVSSRFKGSWYDEIVFLILRSVPLLPSLPVNAAAGILRMRLAPYLVLTVAGSIIKMMIMFMIIGLGMESIAP